MSDILTVSQLTNTLKHAIEHALPYAWVRGEITNVSRAASGHIYFSLREGESLLKCVWFNFAQTNKERFDPLTGEIFEHGTHTNLATSLQNGLHVIAAGPVSVYPQQGVYQLRVERMMPEGEGAYHLAFEESKRQLAKLGYFDQDRKRPLPDNPTRVLVLTSIHGATLHDFLRVAENRGIGSTIRVIPSLVQGDQAPTQLCEALTKAYKLNWAELIVLIRGGGSLQDLMAFNDVELAKKIAKSPVPIITGIGHEPDVSIADMVADVRAATPSHAAQLIWSEQAHLATTLGTHTAQLRNIAKRILANHTQNLHVTCKALQWFSPMSNLQRLSTTTSALKARLNKWAAQATTAKQTQLNSLQQQVHTNIAHLFERQTQQFRLLQTSLQAVNPLAPLERGYSLTLDDTGQILRSVATLSPDSTIRIRMHDGNIDALVTKIHKTSKSL